MKPSSSKIFTDYLIIGSGVAGLRAAIELGSRGKVIVATKDLPTESSTEYAQGGVAVALSDEDEIGIHFEDTIKAGDGLCNEEAVRILVSEGPERIIELINWGAEFDREGSRLAFTLEAAHSRRRILHAHGDSTGREIERVLIKKASTMKNIQKASFTMALDLIVEDGICRGALLLREKEIILCYSKATLLATGGAGQVFLRTTNPRVITGDGMAMAFRAGAYLKDMEFVQFHPTALYARDVPAFLLSEAMRGEGGVLRNIKGEPFMKNYHSLGELAPRDVVSRAIISEMVKTSSSHVYLDMTHLDRDFIRNRFPNIYSTCLKFNIDITRSPIPVSPAAHFIMGGVETDVNGRTNIEGLFAAGEVACTGVHGANRLASNSLLEGLVYGYRAAKECFNYVEGKEERPFPEHIEMKKIVHLDVETVKEMRENLRKTMWEKTGVIRCGESLGIALSKITPYFEQLSKVFSLDPFVIELKNMVTVGLLITLSAFNRKNSVGAHFRSDFKDKTPGWQKHTRVMKREEGIEIFY
ncbi:L-aspartate oxidase [Thermodesulfovibrio sp.]|jgi:L-aspartate oxidase|uniref:L-aspartate oxidase n=1 Tax=Thermodesulfovibrio TaxID=28261 RepID=UPI00260DA0A4|nr:L-aspartate oxidase [Thermodesulfovibrio sp.]